jgi:hypothetical protein
VYPLGDDGLALWQWHTHDVRRRSGVPHAMRFDCLHDQDD